MKIGVIAPEFPPLMGGMAELARGLAVALAAHDEVWVSSFPGNGLQEAPFSTGPEIVGRPLEDRRALADLDREVDAWLALNAGLVPLARSLSRPLFCYCHGNDFLAPWLACGPALFERLRRPYAASVRHALRRWAVARAVPAVRHLFVNSHQTAELLCRRMPASEDRVTVVSPGVADAFFQERDAAASDVLRVLTVTRLSRYTRRKNVAGVLRALRLLPSELRVRYTVVGDGDDRPRLEALARELCVADRVRFAGRVDLDQLLAAYRQADLFVMASKASREDVEGFGIVYLEASAAGVPVICSREGGAIDAVAEGENGFLIDRSTPEAIAAGIERFVAERDRYSPATVRAFAEGFRWPAIAPRLRRELLFRL